MNPHTENITALSYGKLVHENIAQRDLIKHLEQHLDMVKSKLDDALKGINEWRKLNDTLRSDKQSVEDHLEKRIKELVQEHSAKEKVEARCAELERLHSAAVAQSVKFANSLLAERSAHTKLKALCNERGFGTPLFYTPPTLPKPEPIWEVSFYKNGTHIGALTYNYAPSVKCLNDLQESLRATSWKLIYQG